LLTFTERIDDGSVMADQVRRQYLLRHTLRIGLDGEVRGRRRHWSTMAVLLASGARQAAPPGLHHHRHLGRQPREAGARATALHRACDVPGRGEFSSIDMLPQTEQAVALRNPVVTLASSFGCSFHGLADVGVGVGVGTAPAQPGPAMMDVFLASALCVVAQCPGTDCGLNAGALPTPGKAVSDRCTAPAALSYRRG
jgi:hypothetical protein